MKNGRLCGRVSAHDRPGGATPVCLVNEVTPELLADFGRTSRRCFASGATTTAAEAYCPGSIAMPHEQINIATYDGACPAYVFTPENRQAAPEVIYYSMQGIRPTMR